MLRTRAVVVVVLVGLRAKEEEREARYEEMEMVHVFWDFHSEKTNEEADARMKDGWKA